MRSFLRGILGVAAFAAGLGGCFNKADLGEPCGSGDDCDSDSCNWGICTPGGCGSGGSCPEDWTCIEPGALAEIFSFGLANGACALTCEACPQEPRYACGGGICSYDHLPVVTIQGPTEGELGATVMLTAVAEVVEGREVGGVAWSWYEAGQEKTASGPGLALVIAESGSLSVTVVVTDDAGFKGGASTTISVCLAEGAACDGFYDTCCGANQCLYGPDGEPATCSPPPVCGNGVRESGEQCDGADLGTAACTDLEGYDGGTLRCDASCYAYTYEACDRCGLWSDACAVDADCCVGYVCDPTYGCQSV